MRKQIVGMGVWVVLFAAGAMAQTNTFPTSGKVGIGTTSPSYPLDVNGFARFGQGARIQPTASTGDVWYYYPNVVSYTYDTGTGWAAGAIVLHTNIGYTSNEMFKIRVHGYGYGNSSIIDFTVVGYAYNQDVSGYSIRDTGNDDLPKWVGVDSNNNVAIAFGNYGSSYYFYRASADYWSTRKTIDVTASPGWSFNTSTASNLGLSPSHELYFAELDAAVDSNASQQDSVLYSNAYNDGGIELGSGGYASFAGFQYLNLTSSASDYGALIGINTVYDGTNWKTWNGYIRPEALLIGSGTSGGNSGFHFLTSNGLNQGGTPGQIIPMLIEPLTIQDNGNVGIGTPSPARKLEIAGDVQIDGNLYFGSNQQPQSAPYAGCTGGDYAESVNVAGDSTAYAPGDVLVIDPGNPGKFLKSAEPYSALVTGIYSTRPGTVGRRQTGPKASDEVPMAMIGIVPAKVSAENGPIHIGDLLVTSSTVGYAMKGTDRNRMLGAVIGKALGNLDSGTGVIEVVVTLQ